MASEFTKLRSLLRRDFAAARSVIHSLHSGGLELIGSGAEPVNCDARAGEAFEQAGKPSLSEQERATEIDDQKVARGGEPEEVARQFWPQIAPEPHGRFLVFAPEDMPEPRPVIRPDGSLSDGSRSLSIPVNAHRRWQGRGETK
ncbi:hypothetical protein ABIE78_005212 [Sinorhizobium fredii]|uniref:hypothetical protein n=1 Tax=Rhizobium fredii TaxID=380 RepID=UPI001181BD19|nr:hypothetical protein [Sinorhizobium fredii]